MKTSRTLGLILFPTLFAFAVKAAEKTDSIRPSIFAATVEDTAKAENIRLAVSPTIDESHFKSKVVCAEGMVRVRLEGVANRGQELQHLSVPENGLFESVRIVEKNPSTSVVQMIPRRNPEGTCARTAVTIAGSELIISTLFTEAEAERIRAAKERDRLIKEQAQAAAAKKTAASPQPVPDASKEPVEKEKSAAQADDSLVFKKKAEPSNNGVTPRGNTSVLSDPKMLVGFGFAAVIAGLALYMKRKKPILNIDVDKINILSTQRLGLKQQLVLVSVQGTKFLLAVSDKNVTSLGKMSGDESERPRRALLGRPQVESGLNAQSALNVQAALHSQSSVNAQSALESLIGEASRRAVKNEDPIERGPADAFNSELERALGNTALGVEKPRAVGGVDTASNAAGLVALARMRANLKKSNPKSQVFEA